jgi:hypothetical protein
MKYLMNQKFMGKALAGTFLNVNYLQIWKNLHNFHKKYNTESQSNLWLCESTKGFFFQKFAFNCCYSNYTHCLEKLPQNFFPYKI